MPHDSFHTRSTLSIGPAAYSFYDLNKLPNPARLKRLPYCLKLLLENLLRFEDGKSVRTQDIEMLLNWSPANPPETEIAFTPARVLLQDFTGVPAIVDLAAMRDAMQTLGGDPTKINPLSPVELVIDHSVMVDYFGDQKAFDQNVAMEFSRNQERYAFLRWGQTAFKNFRVVPPGTGIVHQVNLEYLARVVFNQTTENTTETLLYPDTLVGTDSHTTMINGLGVLGWGVGGIEAEAAMLGQPLTLLVPEVIGFQLIGALQEGTTATDLVLRVTEMLRQKNVVGKFVEFYGSGLADLPVADRATIANMAPEYGATCGLFPIDQQTLHYLRLSGREENHIQMIEAYAKAQGFFREAQSVDPIYTDTLTLDLSSVEPCIAGPKRPQDRIALRQSQQAFQELMRQEIIDAPVNQKTPFTHGAVVIAAITSCTNTSNPDVMIAAGLLAQKALAKGLKPKAWVKTSMAPGSQVVTDYLQQATLLAPLEQLGFNIVGYGCTTCIGNSGPLDPKVSANIQEHQLAVAAVLSGNRNFEGRIHPEVRFSYLASPPLVVAYALAGTMDIDFEKNPLGFDQKNQPVYLADLWPAKSEIQAILQKALQQSMFKKRYGSVFEGDQRWKTLPIPKSEQFQWQANSTYVRLPPYFAGITKTPPQKLENIQNARVLALLGDSITTDHISPAGSIAKNSPAGHYLLEKGIALEDFNSYGSRRGNHEVMIRGTFANNRLKNSLVPEHKGGMTIHWPSQEILSIFEAALRYQQENCPLIIIAGKEYGTGSSRDWAAKGPRLLGVRAVIAQSLERIHRSNLIGMGILPLEFLPDQSPESLSLLGQEYYNIDLQDLKPKALLNIEARSASGEIKHFEVRCRIDTVKEMDYMQHGGILHYVLRQLCDQKRH